MFPSTSLRFLKLENADGVLDDSVSMDPLGASMRRLLSITGSTGSVNNTNGTGADDLSDTPRSSARHSRSFIETFHGKDSVDEDTVLLTTDASPSYGDGDTNG